MYSRHSHPDAMYIDLRRSTQSRTFIHAAPPTPQQTCHVPCSMSSANGTTIDLGSDLEPVFDTFHANYPQAESTSFFSILTAEHGAERGETRCESLVD